MEIEPARVVECLLAVGCTVDGTEDLVVVPPPWRRDVTDPFDLVEEVARVVGYDQVPSVVPRAPAGRGLTQAQQLRRRVGRTLAGAGFVEVLTFPFVGVEAFDALGLEAGDPRRTALRLANPLSREAPLMTTTLLPGLLETAARNLGRGSVDQALFEVATVTLPEAGAGAPILPVDRRPTDGEWAELQKALPDQPLHLGLVLVGDRERGGWWGPGRPVSWADAIAGVREVATALGLEVDVRSARLAPWHPGRCAEVVLAGPEAGHVVGHAGELHPRVCKAFGLPPRTAAAEVDLSVLLEHAVTVVPAPRLSSFPVAKEDVALVVDAGLPAEALAETLREGAGELCESVRLFDVYTGEQIGVGLKSLAFALRFRAPDRTLTEAETAVARDAAVALAAERHEARQRT
jgi:phenylalanyl-tRNA synthetase beta chain